MTREGSIGVRWYEGDGGMTDPLTGVTGDTFEDEECVMTERSNGGIRVWRECSDRGDVGERGDELGLGLFPGN